MEPQVWPKSPLTFRFRFSANFERLWITVARARHDADEHVHELFVIASGCAKKESLFGTKTKWKEVVSTTGFKCNIISSLSDDVPKKVKHQITHAQSQHSSTVSCEMQTCTSILRSLYINIENRRWHMIYIEIVGSCFSVCVPIQKL